jgi:threonine/homoserine/homoserine lactone efflux protein
MDIATGLILGVVYVAAPGPINVETLRQGMKGGFIASLAVQTGSSIGLMAYATLALLGAGLLLQRTTWQLAAGACGMIVLFYLGITTIRDGHDLVAHRREAGSLPNGTSTRRAFGTGAFLSLANPLEIVFWLSISSRVLHDPAMDALAFLAAFFVGCLGTSLTIVLFASFWQSRLSQKTMIAFSWICGLALIGFGLKLGYSIFLLEM